MVIRKAPESDAADFAGSGAGSDCPASGEDRQRHRPEASRSSGRPPWGDPGTPATLVLLGYIISRRPTGLKTAELATRRVSELGF